MSQLKICLRGALNTRGAVEGHLRSAPLFLPFFLSSSAEPSNPALFRSQGAGGLEPSPASRRAHRPHTARDLLSAPGCHPSAKAPHSPSQAARIGYCARSPGAQSRVLYAILQETAIFFTAAQILRVSSLKKSHLLYHLFSPKLLLHNFNKQQ